MSGSDGGLMAHPKVKVENSHISSLDVLRLTRLLNYFRLTSVSEPMMIFCVTFKQKNSFYTFRLLAFDINSRGDLYITFDGESIFVGMCKTQRVMHRKFRNVKVPDT